MKKKEIYNGQDDETYHENCMYVCVDSKEYLVIERHKKKDYEKWVEKDYLNSKR